MEISLSTLSELNNLINREMESVEQRRLSSVTVDKPYVIKKLTVVNSRFGKVILAHLFDDSSNTTFKSYLPKRVTEYLDVGIMDKINSSDLKYTLTYLGQDQPSFVGGKSRALVKFGLIC